MNMVQINAVISKLSAVSAALTYIEVTKKLAGHYQES